MNLKFVFGLLIIILSTCSMEPKTMAGGIEGQVFIGPMCPVVQQGEKCPDQPYQAILTVTSLQGERIVQIQADEDGRFRIPLHPGEYILHPESPDMLPFASEQAVLVEEGRYTQIIVNYDSGIR